MKTDSPIYRIKYDIMWKVINDMNIPYSRMLCWYILLRICIAIVSDDITDVVCYVIMNNPMKKAWGCKWFVTP